MIQHLPHESSVPQKCLRGELIDTIYVPKLRICDGFVQREVGREEGDENVTEWPVFHLCNPGSESSIPSYWYQLFFEHRRTVVAYLRPG